MTETEKLVPRRRFREFVNCGAWEQRKAADIAEYSKGNGYSKSDLTEVGVPIILYGSLYTKYQFFIDEVDTFSEVKNGAIFSKGNEVIIPASGETAEDIARASAVIKSGVLLGGDLNIVRPFDYINPLFLALEISNGEPQKELAKKAQGKSVVHIHNSDIQEVIISYPERQEQDRIVDVFSSIDNIITLHQHKVEKIKALKSAYLSEMFPAEGECRPKRRFAGFNEDWEQRKLGELTNYKNGKGHEDKQSSEGKYELINLNSISIDGGLKSSNRFIDEADETLLLNDLVMVLSDVGHGNLLGRVAIIPENNRFVLNQRVALLRPIGDINPYFLFSYINAHQDYFKKQGAGSSQLNISRDCVENFVVALPKYQEQERISKYFIHLDNLITHHQQKLEKLQDIKKAFLNEMFI